MIENTLNNQIKQLKRRLAPDEAFVALREEFGFRYWFWFPEISQQELITYWKRLNEVNKISNLPGSLILAEGGYKDGRQPIPYGEVTQTPYGDIHEFFNNPLKDLWDKLADHSPAYYAHVFDETNSVLICKNPHQKVYPRGRYEALIREEKMFGKPIKRKKFDEIYPG